MSDETTVGYVPKPIQLELRRAWRLIHIEDKYTEGMKIIIDLSGMPENRIDWTRDTADETLHVINCSLGCGEADGDIGELCSSCGNTIMFNMNFRKRV